MSGKRAKSRYVRLGSQPILVGVVVIALLFLGAVLTIHYATRATASTAQSRFDSQVSSSAAGRDLVIGHAKSVAAMPVPSVASPDDPLRVYALTTAFPQSGPATFHDATTTGPILGITGRIRKFHLAIESNIKVVNPADVIAKIDATLGDPRSWVGGRQYRLQQVPGNVPAEFGIFLSTPKTVDKLCAPLHTGGFTSCRQGPKVVLNLARWMTSVSGYRNNEIVLDTYRTYMINHEVGHALGHGHELCPGPGKPAPVMEQQTLGLHGCQPNPWVYVAGKKYDGPPGQY